METCGPQILLTLDHVKSGTFSRQIKIVKKPRKHLHRIVFEQEPGDPGVYWAVADDEDVEERLAQAAPVLHLPAGGVVLPHVKGVVPGLGLLVDADLVLLVVSVFPPEELCPGDQLPPSLVVHEPTQLGLDHLLHGLGATLGEGLHQQPTLLVVCELVKRTVILGASSGNDTIQNNTGIKNGFLVATVPHHELNNFSQIFYTVTQIIPQSHDFIVITGPLSGH